MKNGIFSKMQEDETPSMTQLSYPAKIGLFKRHYATQGSGVRTVG